MNQRKLFLSLFFCLIPSAYAASFDIFGIGGVGFSKISNDPDVEINSFVSNQYNTNSEYHTKGVYGGGIGVLFDSLPPNPIFLALNLSGYHSELGEISGIEHPFINAGLFDTLNYQFKASSNAMMLEPVFIYKNYRWEPYIIGGIGLAWNRLHHYSEAPTDPAGSAAPLPVLFQDHTTTSFAYEIGLGVQRMFYTDPKKRFGMALSLDYRYFNMGNAELGDIPTQRNTHALEVSQLDSQWILLSLKAYWL